jgi:hypothetical protein
MVREKVGALEVEHLVQTADSYGESVERVLQAVHWAMGSHAVA